MLQIRFVYLALSVALFGVAIHIAAIAGGPSWYAFFGAPPRIVESAQAGTWLAPVSTLGIALLMGICAAYAASALGLVRRLPLERTMLAGMTAVCLLRALVVAPVALSRPEMFTWFNVIASLVWGFAGLGFLAGFRMRQREARVKPVIWERTLP